MKEMSLTQQDQNLTVSYRGKENQDPQFKPTSLKRNRKSSEQLQLLLKEYEKEPVWSKEFILELSKVTGLTTAQIYKWSWDQKKKTQQADRNRTPYASLSSLFREAVVSQPLRMNLIDYKSDETLVCNETLPLSQLELQILEIQTSYKLSLDRSCQSRALRSILSEFL